jgi:hypothetical protein
MRKRDRILVVGMSLLPVWLWTREFLTPRHSALAQSPTPIFTITSTGNGALITD